MRLNRWKQIGVIASVVWILGAGGYTYYSETKDIEHLASSVTQECLTTLTNEPGRSAECANRGDSFRKSLPKVKYIALGVAVIPVPLVWGLAYLVLFVVRWARRRWALLHGKTAVKSGVCAVILTLVLLTGKACWPPPPHAATSIWVGNADIKNDSSQDAVSAFANAFAVEPACRGLTLSLNDMPSKPIRATPTKKLRMVLHTGFTGGWI